MNLPMNTPYHDWVEELERWWQRGAQLPCGGFAPCPRPVLGPEAPCALYFAPHPDDECIIGALALRLFREAGVRLVNVAVTLGRKPERRQPRLAELRQACAFLGYELELSAPNGFDEVHLRTRREDPVRWNAMVDRIAELLVRYRPVAIFFPHERDWNSTHIGTHYLVVDALQRVGSDFGCRVFETEFWGAMEDPNLMVEVAPALLADLIAATTFHLGEVQRNPYHLTLPAWMMDNVRRGAELVGGQGAAAPPFQFAQLFRFRLWRGGRWEEIPGAEKLLPASVSAAKLLA
jgi:LmbE family N-acetylglucosaminyl deacetylase